MIRALALSLCLATPALADFPETVRDHILPGYAGLATATQDLADVSAQSCDPQDLRPAYHAAFDAWMGVQHLRFGPVEQGGLGLAIAYWPDPKGSGRRAQMAILTGDADVLEPARFAEQSVAARGLFALERLLYPNAELPADPCPLIRATTADLARIAGVVYAGWEDGYAETLLTAGEAGNTTYLTRPEARQALFTQLATALEFTDDTRLGRPLGSFTRPRPERAEALASGRPLRNILLSLQAQRAMVETLTPDAPHTIAAFDHAIAVGEALDDPLLAGVAEPESRLKVEILQQAIEALRQTVLSELGPELDVGIGFNAADGD
ncbi:imelysin family protein [Pseudorhodobacter aquimaris]|uniref:imelysin family protein n=1 Tax=Pseudorhodobacter aquimaris TaxID=687412 RepID=UPI00067CA076|nr:imelysin family protein [Pseudorhodobacter aquimaris]